MIEEFKAQYIEKVLHGSGFDDELNVLFEKVLLEEFNDDAEKMTLLINSINSEVEGTPELPQEPTNSDLQKQIAEMQATIDQLLDIITS